MKVLREKKKGEQESNPGPQSENGRLMPYSNFLMIAAAFKMKTHRLPSLFYPWVAMSS